MAEHPFMPLWTDAYLGDTTHLTTVEHGAYLLLLMTMWRAGGSLPDDDKMLARYARLTKAQWARVKPVLIGFFRVKDGQITQGRLTDELNAVRQHSKRQSDRAKARWLKNKETSDATAMPERCNHTHTHISPNGDTPLSPPKDEIAEPEKPRRKRSVKTRLPDDWQPSPTLIAFAQEKGLSASEIQHETDQFRDHWQAKGETRASWDASFRTWVRNAHKWRKPQREDDAARTNRRLAEWAGSGDDLAGSAGGVGGWKPDTGPDGYDVRSHGSPMGQADRRRPNGEAGFRGLLAPARPVPERDCAGGGGPLAGPVPSDAWGASGGMSEIGGQAARPQTAQALRGSFADGRGVERTSRPGASAGGARAMGRNDQLDFGACGGGVDQAWGGGRVH